MLPKKKTTTQHKKRGDVNLFEKLTLEGAQSGLSWLTILRKREAYRRVFYNFDIDRVASMTSDDVQRILEEDFGSTEANKRNVIVRHRGKIESVINNARCIQTMREDLQAEEEEEAKQNSDGDVDMDMVFDKFLWGFVSNKPIYACNWDGRNLSTVETTSSHSIEMSKSLKKKGFKFVGPTTCFAMMQSVGMILHHPKNSPESMTALKRLQSRPDGYQAITKLE